MSFMDVLRTAVFALRGNWMRSALTSLGVIIGIAAVIVMVSVGQGTQAEIDKMVSGLGSQRLDISPGGGRGPGGGARMSASSFFTLTEDDVAEFSRLADEVTVVDLLDELPEEQRAAVRARLVDERAYGDIALAEGVSEAAIRQRVSRGLASLRERIGGER